MVLPNGMLQAGITPVRLANCLGLNLQFCETDSSIPAQVIIKRIKPPLFQPPVQ